MLMSAEPLTAARTEALRRVLGVAGSRASADDLLFLEAWEAQPYPLIGATLRAYQIRRANPALAAEIHAEMARGRPLTVHERAAL